ncbi:sugar-binding transcriptional regulator [Alkalicoccobacillus murimartini]|nr:sugar-binding domain-containing protein [Alkalicoccobacillus murimartini]
MRKLVNIQKQLVPELVETMQKRYRMLQFVYLRQPIGRRALAVNLQLSERVVRGEVTFLKEQRLVTFTTAGMSLTREGETVLVQLDDTMKELLGLKAFESELQDKLGVKKAVIVAGDSDEEDWVKQEMGQACVKELKAIIEPRSVVAVMGGTTLAAVAQMMTPDPKVSQTIFVPARGGLGERVENQANTISAEFADRAGAEYRLMHVPDQLSEEAYASLVMEPSVKEILDLIKTSRILLHGIGDATRMAARRSSEEPFMNKLKREHAIAEAFGYYFNQSGEIIHKQRTIGLQLDELDTGKHVISVAGGASKANAIKAYMQHRPSDVLITDEAAARRLLQEI